MAGGRLEAFFTVAAGSTVSATNSGGGPTSVSISGTHTPTSFVAHLVARLNAVRTPANWSGSLSTGANGTGLVTLNCTGTWALTFTTAEAGTVIGFVGNIGSRSSAATGTQNARGLWMSDCPLQTDQHPSIAVAVTDDRSSESPDGTTITIGGTSKYEHTGLRYSHVVESRIREAAGVAAGYTYRTLEQWYKDTQIGAGHTWFSRGSAFQAYWDNAGNDALVGLDMNSGAGPSYGWSISPTVPWSRLTKRVDTAWNGMWSVEIPRVISKG